MTIMWNRIGEALRQRRIRRGLTRAALANKVDVSPAMITYLEQGERRPSIELLDALASALGCRVADLIPETKPRRVRK
jgi:transcriptional regulator with XRE-family HTH domain